MRGLDLLAWLASVSPSTRDLAIEDYLGIAEPGVASTPPGEHLIGYHASGVASIVRMLVDVPVAPDDVVIDLGSGLGKVVLLTSLLIGASTRGIELQAALVDRAREAATRCQADVRFTCADVRAADLEDGTVFFLYVPFTGPVLLETLGRLEAIASRRAIVVCALGLELDRLASWLVRRPSDSFWLSTYDSIEFSGRRRASQQSLISGPLAEAIASERRSDDVVLRDGPRWTMSAPPPRTCDRKRRRRRCTSNPSTGIR